jgi:hypothetical protein
LRTLPSSTAIPRLQCSLLRSLTHNCSSASGRRYSRLLPAVLSRFSIVKRIRARQCKKVQDRISGYSDDVSRLSSETLIEKINHESSCSGLFIAMGSTSFFIARMIFRNSHNLPRPGLSSNAQSLVPLTAIFYNYPFKFHK